MAPMAWLSFQYALKLSYTLFKMKKGFVVKKTNCLLFLGRRRRERSVTFINAYETSNMLTRQYQKVLVQKKLENI